MRRAGATLLALLISPLAGGASAIHGFAPLGPPWPGGASAIHGFAPLGPPWPGGAAELRVAAVQFEVSERVFHSIEDFRVAVNRSLDKAFAGFSPDLVVFPEYTAAFLAIVPYAEEVRGAEDLPEAFRRARRIEPSLTGIRGLLLRQAPFVEKTVKEVFGGAARSRRIWILAGSFFARDSGADGRGELRNRACLFSPDGVLVYFQDKVFLTDLETEMLGLSAGRMREAGLFFVKGKRVALTICRDSFKDGWEEKLRGAFLWIDIRANGVPFTLREREGFREGMPARLPSALVDYGLTVCLVGRNMGQIWEGETSLWALGPAGAEERARCPAHATEDVLRVELGGQPVPPASPPPVSGFR